MMSNTTSALQHLIDEAQRLPSTTQRDVMRFAIAGYLIGSMKHLPGQHDQSTHGHGGTNRAASGATEAGDDSSHIERMGIVSETASELGVSPDIIEYGGDGYAFSVGDDNFIAAGQYDPATGKITLYKGALSSGEMETRGITAHEVQHAKFQEVYYKKYREEASGINAEYRENNYANADDIMSASGRPKGIYAEKYPVYNALMPYMEGEQFDLLVKRDGITDYSTSYWKAYNQGKVSARTAINETLAEVAHQKAVGIRTGIPNVWRGLYNEVNAQYDRLKAASD